MIGVKTPFRVSFAGGGSDLKAFYSKYPGCVVSTTIDKYMYLFTHPFFDKKIQVKYSQTELVEKVEDIKHPIVRTILSKFDTNGIDLNSIADIPAGTGLGSSSSFTIGLLHALYAYTGKYVSKQQLAEEACETEIEILKEPIGKQDQYAAAFGGLNFIRFHPNEDVTVEPIPMPKKKLAQLNENLMLFYLGGSRSAKSILNKQQTNIVNDKEKFETLVRMTDLAKQLREMLADGNIDSMGMILHENWVLKRTLTRKISNDMIDEYYETALKNGAKGGKLLGAGGAGFLLFYCEKGLQDKLRAALKDLREIKFVFDNYGSRIIHYEMNV